MAFTTREATVTSPSAVGVVSGLRTNAVGTRGIVFLLVSAAAPLTVVVGIAPLAIAVGGVGAPVIYIVAALTLALFAIGFMALTRHVNSYSGFYGYISKTLGPVVGLAAGLTAWTSYNGLQIGLYGLLGIQANLAVKSFTGIELPWWLYGIVAIAAVWYLGWRGINVGIRVVAVVLTLETVIVAIVAAFVLVKGGAYGIGFDSFSSEAIFSPQFAAVMALGFSAFMGFEAGALYREEARDPDRSVPRATYISIAFIGAFYAFAVWIIVQAFGPAVVQDFASGHLDDGNTAYIAAGNFVGEWCVNVMSILIVTSIFAAQLAFHNTINRYTLSLSREGVFPAWASKINPRYRTPSTAGVVQSVLAVSSVLLFAAFQLDPFTQFLIWMNTPGVLGVLFLQALTGVGVVVYFVRHKECTLKWYVIPSAIVATVVMLTVSFLMLSTLELMTGSPPGSALNTFLSLIFPSVFVIGAAMALILRRVRPDIYQRIGQGIGE